MTAGDRWHLDCPGIHLSVQDVLCEWVGRHQRLVTLREVSAYLRQQALDNGEFAKAAHYLGSAAFQEQDAIDALLEAAEDIEADIRELETGG